jgi:hypothetical protein
VRKLVYLCISFQPPIFLRFFFFFFFFFFSKKTAKSHRKTPPFFLLPVPLSDPVAVTAAMLAASVPLCGGSSDPAAVTERGMCVVRLTTRAVSSWLDRFRGFFFFF